MMGKDQIELIEDAHGERIWQPVFWVNSKTGPELIACNLLDTHSAAYAVAEKEADTFAAKEATKPISERRQVRGFGARNIDAPAPSQQQLRPVDSRLVNIDRLAQEIARAMGLSKVDFAIKAMTIANAVFAKASRGEIQLYCEAVPYPFDKDESETMHGGLRLTIADADALRSFYLVQADDLTLTHEIVEKAEAKKLDCITHQGLPTTSIALCFAGLHWVTEEQWKKPLGDKPKWLKACVTTPGQKGVVEIHWDPVRLGAALIRDKGINVKSVRARFQTNHLLKPYLAAWHDYEDEYFQGQ